MLIRGGVGIRWGIGVIGIFSWGGRCVWVVYCYFIDGDGDGDGDDNYVFIYVLF